MPRYHGFTCPKCGGHTFSSGRIPANWPGGPKPNTGHCTAREHSGKDCHFTWNRDDPAAEAEAIYYMTPEEWDASYVPRRSTVEGDPLA